MAVGLVIEFRNDTVAVVSVDGVQNSDSGVSDE